MPAPTFLDLAASIDNELKRNIRWPVRLVTAAGVTNLSILDAIVRADATLGAQAINLPDATTCKGMVFQFQKKDASVNTITIASIVGGQTINGQPSKVLATQNDFLIVVSDGANFFVTSQLITPAAAGSALYTAKGISKIDGVLPTLTPVPGTQIPFTVSVDGVCVFWVKGEFVGAFPVPSGTISVRIDGVTTYELGVYALNNGSGGDNVFDWTLAGSIPLFLLAGAHTCEIMAANVGLALQASVANPLTISVLYPGSVVVSSAVTPEAARVRKSANQSANPVVTLSFDVVDQNDGGVYSVAQPTRLTAQLGGWYNSVAELLFDQGIDGSFRSVKIRKNGVTIVAEDQRDDYVHNTTQRSLLADTGAIPLNPGDYLEVIAESDGTDGDEVVLALSDFSPVFTLVRLIPGSVNLDISARIARSTVQSIANATPTALSFDTIIYDTSLFFVIGSPTKLTIPVDGKYDISAAIQWAAAVLGSREMFIRKNGATMVELARVLTLGAADTVPLEAHARGIPCVAGDYFEVIVTQSSTAALNVATDGGTFFPVFYAKKVN
jgi:hypothetical protein